MLTEEQLHLLTGAIDGELTAAETRRLRLLLKTSPEAKKLHDQFQADRNSLRTLPLVEPPAFLLSRVMTKIAATTPRPPIIPTSTENIPSVNAEKLSQPRGVSERTAPVKSFGKLRRWVPVALAASLLLAITSSSFWFFSRASDKSANFAQQSQHRPPPATQRGAQDPDWAKWLPSESPTQLVAPTPQVASSSSPQPEANPTTALPGVTPVPTQITSAPAPRTARNDTIMGAELRPDTPPLDLIQVRVPFLRALSEFDQEETRKQFSQELGRDPAFRVDVFVRNLPRGLESFRTAARESALSLVLDPTTVERVNKGQVGSVVAYTESLTSTELAELLAKLSSEDAKISPRLFDVIHAMPVIQNDVEALRGILGIDPGLFKRPTEKTADNNKPISAGTADQIVKSLTTPPGKTPEKTAFLTNWLPVSARNNPSGLAEVKQYLVKRGERKPNAVPVMIVIRHTNG